MFITQSPRLVRPSKQLKEIEHNIVKNSNLPAGKPDIINKKAGDRGLSYGEVVRAELEPGIAGLRVRHADYSATLPPGSSLTPLNNLFSKVAGQVSHFGVLD